MSTTLTPTEVASEFDTDSKTLRKFLRSVTPRDEQPGKGGRWAVPGTKAQLNKLRKQFNTWHAAELEARAARAAEKAAQAKSDADSQGDTEVDETE